MQESSRKVIGIGETVLDIIFQDNHPLDAVPGGSCFNSIISLARAGAKTQFISEVGDDRVGHLTLDFLSDNHVDSSLVNRRPDIKSPLSLAFLTGEHHNAEYVFYKDHAHSRLEQLRPEVNADDIVLFSSYFALNSAIRPAVADFLRYAHDRGAILYYDVNFRTSHADEKKTLQPTMEENFRLADVLRGSDEDFQVIYGMEGIRPLFEQHLAGHLMADGHAATFIYTRGHKPVEVLSACPSSDGPMMDVTTYGVTPIQSVSTIGAGDNFNAGFVFGLIQEGITREDLHHGLSPDQLHRLIHYAQSFAAACCQSIYNYVPKGFEVE